MIFRARGKEEKMFDAVVRTEEVTPYLLINKRDVQKKEQLVCLNGDHIFFIETGTNWVEFRHDEEETLGRRKSDFNREQKRQTMN